MEALKGLSAFFLWISLIFASIHSAAGSPLSSAVERRALLNLRASLGLRARDWPIKAEPCSFWTGVSCSNGRVTGITVSGLKRTRLGRLNPSFKVDSLANFTMLVSFNASGFPLPGTIPEWFGSSFPSLEHLDLRSCKIYGSIPTSLGNLSKLHSLYLSSNNLAGSIPAALGQLIELQSLDLSMNSLTGPIPSTFASLGKVSELLLGSNFLSGSIPPVLGSISNLSVLNLSDNNLAGSIPSQLGSLSRLIELDLSKNALSGSLPLKLKELKSLQKFMIEENKLDGALPGELLLSMPKLLLLDLSSNNFTGELTGLGDDSRSNASSMVFNLSNNLLYGRLSFEFGVFKVIDLSGNYFQGVARVGNGGNASLDQNCLQVRQNQRPLDDCRAFYTGRGLSFDNFGFPDTLQPPAQNQQNKRRWIFILVGVLGGLGFIAILILLLVLLLRKCIKRRAKQKRNSNVGPVPEGDSPQLPKDSSVVSGYGQPFTYEQLFQATDSFNELYLIKHGHSGDIYRGTLEGESTIIIKKASLRSVKKESYTVELELFSKLLHARFVPLLGHCVEDESEKLLVYKYMPNGDLATSFYRASNSEDENTQSLDWITRLKIAIGAAEGLSYLHHECNPPLVHRDVQASSILLDDKFEVRLGSLSEVCVQEGDSHQKMLPRFLRKPQTSEPGPSGTQSSANCAYDVYCFGKVLLELITGKLGVSKTDDVSTREWLEQTLACISVFDKELVTKIMDPSLIVDEDLLEEVWAMAIVARSCLNPKPSKRPPMKYVLKALENPLKVVREESFSSARLRTTSSRRSWSATLFGSWRQNSSEGANVAGQASRDALGGLKQSGRHGSQGSGGNDHSSSNKDHSSSNKRLSNEIFPEPLEEMERLA